MFDDQTSHLEIAVYDHDTGGRDDIMGRYVVSGTECVMESGDDNNNDGGDDDNNSNDDDDDNRNHSKAL